MSNVQPGQLQELKQLLLQYHSGHQNEQGPMESCQEATCVEAKQGLQYLDPNGSLKPEASSFD
jgi:hypothetical protein